MSFYRGFQRLVSQTIPKLPFSLRGVNVYSLKFSSYAPSEYGHDRDPAPAFFDDEIQSLLKSLTRIDYSEVFKTRKLGVPTLEKPVYKFMTDEQLQETLMEAVKSAEELLQMPPVIQVRKPRTKVLIEDPALQGFEANKYIFTDVTFGVKDSKRLIVIRDTDGTLKEADWDVRDRMNQIYFPKSCQNLKVPRMFEEEYLKDLLSRGEYKFILDRACAQFEPDHPEYQRINSLTYRHVNDNGDFQKLRSTRHFGPLVFYLAWFKSVDNLLLELIETAHVEEANSLLHLYSKLHRIELNTENPTSLDGICQYVSQEACKKGPLELALQAYKDLQKQKSTLHQNIDIPHSLV